MSDTRRATPARDGSRRDFLRAGAAASLAVVASRLGAGVSEAVPAPSASVEIEEATVASLRQAMDSGALSSHALTEACLARIEALDRRGPALHHVIETNPDALAIAEALDVERRAKGPRGPLHGIPILLKDNVDTADRQATTAGSLALAGSFAPQDSFVAARLRAAGAVILGKANLSEWANIRSNRSTSGWSARGGQGRNPYVLDRTPCGSSSGSAGAVAASYCPLAVGTETDGSIVCPSSTMGIVGLKPTLGLVSRAGVIPIAHSQDTAGPMARTVRDAALMLAALVGPDPRDPATAASAAHVVADYTRGLDENGLRGARVGVARSLFGFHPDVDRVMESALAAMKSQGAILIDPANIPHQGDYNETELEVLLYELKADLNAYLAGRGPSAAVHTLADVIAFNESHKAEEMPYFGQELFLKAQAKGPLTSEPYLKALKKNHRLSQKEGLDAILDQHHLDALVAPAGGPGWVIDPVDGDHFGGGSSSPAAVAGYPNLCVPAGFAFGLPVGISFIGRAWSEATLLRIGYAFEQATKARRPPRFLRTVDLGPDPS